MHKTFLILVVLALFGSHLNQAVGQATGTQTQPLTNIKSPKNPTSSVTVIAASREPKVEAMRLFQEGTKLAEVGQFSQAAETFQQALKLQPDYADAYAALGRAYFKMQQWQKASDNLRRAAALHTKQREAQNPPEKREQASTPVRPDPTPEKAPQQTTNANATSVKTQQPQQRKEANAPGNASAGNPQIKPPQVPNANATSVRTQQPQQWKEANPPGNASAGNPLIKPPQAINANALGVKALAPQTETTRPVEQAAEVSTPLKATPSNAKTKLQQEVNASADQGKTARAKSETTQELAKVAGDGPALKSGDDNGLEQKQEPVGFPVSMKVTPASSPVETKSVIPISIKVSNDDASLTKIYRVGPGDVLDVRINESPSAQSTLFTVTPSGLLEHPILTEPLSVTGFTVEEIGTKIEDDLKKRALIDDPKVIVGVRDYASHTILVSGLVKDSGTRFLRREAIPLYVVVADAQPLPEAARVTVVRNEVNQMYEIDLTQTADMNLLVRPGDVITLHPNETQFIYIGGDVKFPGEKPFRRGLTLTQAIISSGGLTPKSKVAEIGRDDGRGFLVGTRFSLTDIQSGKAVDPLLKPGDRIMILR
jgi:protein involved in polysaccharide export with SLBB domain/tetratricopeptide (TPR) repeat protein